MNRHKISQVAFTRTRKLTFIVMFTLLIRKSVKSIQLLLNEFLLDTHQHFSITAGAFTKARKNLNIPHSLNLMSYLSIFTIETMM